MTVSATGSLAGFLAASRGRIDAAMDRYLPRPPACPPLLSEAMRYSLLAGGKRLRPVLVLAAAGLVYGSLLAFRQPDVRWVIAYSSMGQMSLIVLGIFAANDLGDAAKKIVAEVKQAVPA